MNQLAKHAALVTLVTLLACDDGGRPRSGVPSSKPLDDLTSSEFYRLCAWALGPLRIRATDKQICTYFGAQTSETDFDCERATQSCLAEGSEVDLTECPFSSSGFAGCSLSVADLEDCYTRAVAEQNRAYARASCSMLNEPRWTPPASCQRIFDYCPGVFDGPDDDTTLPDDEVFVCDDGSQIRAAETCDGFSDCSNGEDELCGGGGSGGTDSGGDTGGGTSGSNGFVDGGYVCNDGQDIDDAFRCDGDRDCFSGEDELNCTGIDVPNEGFDCRDGKIIDPNFVCDGNRDCKQGQDEKKCDGGFICNDGFDISDQWKCDGTVDCGEGEDELGC